MKIPLMYGLMATLVLILWVLATHTLVPNPNSVVHTLGAPVFFNILHFVVIFLGLKALERQKGDKPAFKEAVKTGVSIAFAYALTSSLFFVVLVYLAGTAWLATEPGAAANLSPGQLLLRALAGWFVFTMIFGLIYSTVIAFFVAKRRSETTGLG